MLQIHTLVNGPIQENAYVLHLTGQSEAIVIDPGDEAGRLEKEIRARGLKTVLILATLARAAR